VTFEAPRNAFFTLAVPSYTSAQSKKIVHPEDVKGLTIIEELNKSVQGSLSLNDPSMMYPRLLRNNAEILLSWGYKANGMPLEYMFGQGDVDKFSKNYERRGLSVLVLNPSGEGLADGSASFSCGFLAKGWHGSPIFATYDSGTKYQVVEQAMFRMGVTKNAIRFDASSDKYSSESVERQSETDFQFLARLASEWRCFFRMGYSPDGETFAIFSEFKYAGQVQQAVFAGVGGVFASPVISWRNSNRGDLLAINYNWANEEGENGQGDNVKITYVNGHPMYQRFTMSGDSIMVWTLDTDAVSQYVKDGHDITPVMSAESFDDPNVKQFWIPAKQTTAPNGLGYTISIHMLGNPSLTAGMVLHLGSGFPAIFDRTDEGSPIQFIIRKASHTIGTGGYFTDLEVVDIATISAVGVR
jgi:hypothetical protein